MADPYLPPQPGSPGSYDQPRMVRDPSSGQPSRPMPAADAPRSGFGTGILVALVFVVVAILAAVFFRPGMPEIEATTPAAEAPAEAPAMDAPAAEAPAADMAPAEPDATVAPVEPEAVQPDAGATDPAAPPSTGTTSP
jgi:hypothetical protein